MTTTDAQATETMFTAGELYDRVLSGEPLFILDVRNADEYKRMRVEGHRNLESVNIPYFEFIEDEDGMCARVPADREVLVICAKEGSSQYVAGLLQERGIKAGYLQGGFVSWGNFYDVREVVSADWGTIVQIARPARGDLSFALVSDGKAALIDPLRHIDVYQQALADAGAELTHIFDTHVHADHISGGPALSQASGAPYYVHAYDAIHPIDMLPATIAYTSMEDGQQFSVGQITITAIWYPGHTLGQMNYLATAPDGGRYLFTGDGIFLRSFGRPDLGGRGEAWTPMLYDSMFRRLPPYLTAETMILPAHFSTIDEDAGGGIFAEPYSTLLTHNDALRPRTLEEFSAFVLSHLPVFPPEYVEIKRVNIGLSTPTEEQASELELGKNICALAE
ncbi:MBL fold metallo-hydrolase [Oscillochloris sp. ZM17-4]|uniref:MBL fold metallo-hydrolase n=1 Tax=Oscillochloris sp. ZM17-4 TaxID=2866714 RepID=UPI001C72EA36|nr:MBL fold metallo-hydrolase [Oscillochloris sp. ZM17-4]MBX0330922.1 MBL fold metallo-hydrolase [Oscillochloris sp. ZM17-4]